MGTKERLQIIKEIVATVFLSATKQSKGTGLQFKYKSYPHKDKNFKGWKFDIIVSESGYGSKTIQEFRFQKPNNIDVKNMEYNVLLSVLTTITQTAMLSWYQLGLMLNTDTELQEQAKNL